MTSFFQRPQAPNAHFLHLGKTGGSAIKSALQENAWPADYQIHCHPHEVRLKDIPVGEKIFFFVRDPVTRFVSGFLSRKRRGRPRYNVEWTAGETEAFAKFPTPNDLATALSDTDATRKSQAAAAMGAIGHVRESYWEWFGNGSELSRRAEDILFIGFTETLDQDFETLKQKLGLPADLHLPTDPVLAHRTPSGQPTELSEIGRKNLRHWYAADYDLIQWARDCRRAD